MAAINIDELSEVELIDLNHRIVERLRFLSQMRAHSQMLDFKIGERVTFHPDGYPPLVGIVARYNRKSLTVVTDAGQRWNIAPSLLRRADARERNHAADPKVVRQKETSSLLFSRRSSLAYYFISSIDKSGTLQSLMPVVRRFSRLT